MTGYSGNLDLDKAYISGDEWNAYAQGNSSFDPNLKPILRKGDRNEYVKAWQTYLNVNGYQCGEADGIFGEKTEKAVIKYQQDHQIEAGYIGEQTWNTL